MSFACGPALPYTGYMGRALAGMLNEMDRRERVALCHFGFS